MPSELANAFDVALRVAAALDALGVPYFLGGSLASSIHGEPRMTNDIDLVVDLPVARIGDWAAALGADFELDQDALAEAVRRRGSWNLYYLPLLTKVDIFQLGAMPFDQVEFAGRQVVELGPGRRIFVKRPEDSVLRKLQWFQQGGGASGKQWRDVVEILRVCADRLDSTHLDRWSRELGVAELLARARVEADR